jgi:hypothetical protein
VLYNKLVLDCNVNVTILVNQKGWISRMCAIDVARILREGGGGLELFSGLK